jgi:hypothetical protein
MMDAAMAHLRSSSSSSSHRDSIDCPVAVSCSETETKTVAFAMLPTMAGESGASGGGGSGSRGTNNECLLAVRLLTWVEGETLSDFAIRTLNNDGDDNGDDDDDDDNADDDGRALLVGAGEFLGKMTTSLSSFDHPAASRSHSWDLRSTSALRKFTHLLPDPQVVPSR